MRQIIKMAKKWRIQQRDESFLNTGYVMICNFQIIDWCDELPEPFTVVTGLLAVRSDDVVLIAQGKDKYRATNWSPIF